MRTPSYRLIDIEQKLVVCTEPVTLTLTSRRNRDPIELTTELRRTLVRSAAAYFGARDVKKKRIFWCCVTVQEEHAIDGWHFHILLAAPNGWTKKKASPYQGWIGDLIVDEWVAADRTNRRHHLQKAVPAYDAGGWLTYMHKRIDDQVDASSIDYMNTHRGLDI